MHSDHVFKERTFPKLTYCDYCTKLLWGLAKQGVSCEACDFTCHRKCSELVYDNCIRSMSASPQNDHLSKSSTMSSSASSLTSSTTTSPKPTKKSSVRVAIPPAIVSSSQPLQTLAEPSLSKSKSKKKQQQQDLETKPTKPLGAGFLEEAVISAAIRMTFPTDLSSLPKNDHPSLSIHATTVNFTRFVHKTTGLFWFQDKVEDILTWKDPWNTAIVLVIYCFVCIYPVLAMLLPQTILLTIMIYFFQQKSTKQQQRILPIRKSSLGRVPTTSTVTTTTLNNNYVEAQEKAHLRRHHVYHDDQDLVSDSDSEEDSGRSSGSVQYLSNLQHIQNMMGDVADAHDVLKPMFAHLDWSDEAEAIMIVQGAMVAFVAMSVAMWFIPWRWVFMIGGATGMLANSPWGKVVVKEGAPLMKDLSVWARAKVLAFGNKKSVM